MLKYNSFKVEKLLESMVNESYIYYSPDFRKILKRFKDNDIATDLLSIENTDVKPDTSFIGLSDKDGFVKFNQLKKGISQIEKWAKDEEKDASSAINNINDGEWSNTTWDYYNQKDGYPLLKGNDLKVGKLVNGIFGDKYTSKEVEEFVNKYKGILSKGIEFKLVSGEEIVNWYSQLTYAETGYGSGTLGSSCMRYNNCRTYFGIYVENDVKMLILLDEDDKLIGRALVWKLNEPLYNDDRLFMDRIYVSEDKYLSVFREYAVKEGWAYRESVSASTFSRVSYKGEILYNQNLTVKLDKWKFDEYPFMDTFKTLDTKTGILYNDDDENVDEEDLYMLEETNGGYKMINAGVYSEYYETRIDEDDAVYSEPLRDYLYFNTAVEVRIGTRRGWYPIDYEEIVYDSYREEYIHEIDSVYIEYYQEYIYDEDEIECVVFFGGINDYQKETLSVNDNNVIDMTYLSSRDYLRLNDIDYPFHRDILSQGKFAYYISDLSISIFKTGKGDYSKTDATILGLNVIPNNQYDTDIIDYNTNILMDKQKENIRSGCARKIKYYQDILNNKGQLSLDFGNEDNDEYLKSVEKTIERFQNRLEELDSFE